MAFAWQASAQGQNYVDLLRRCSQHEKRAIASEATFQFFQHTQSDSGSETRIVIETPQGRVDRIIAVNNKPLTPIQDQKEQERLSKFLRDTAALNKEISDQHEDDKRRELMIEALPDAFIVEFSGVESDGRLRFTFRPNPDFSPQNRETQVFKGMQGWLWVDPVSERIAEIRGELFKDVSFGWGILGRLYKGGRFEVLQSEIAPGVWRITTLNVDFKGRLMLFRPLQILHKEITHGFVLRPRGQDARAAVKQLLERYSATTAAARSSEIRESIRNNQ